MGTKSTAPDESLNSEIDEGVNGVALNENEEFMEKTDDEDEEAGSKGDLAGICCGCCGGVVQGLDSGIGIFTSAAT